MMGAMRLCFLLLSGVLLAQQPAPLTDKGVFRILAEGKQIGTERFEIESTGSGYRARGDLQVRMPGAGEATESSVLNLNGNFEVTSYTRIQKAPKKASAQVEFSSGTAKAHYVGTSGEADYVYYLEPKVVVLDTNFFHHYVFLLEQYQMQKGGAQHVQVFIPQEGTPGMVLLEHAGKDGSNDKWVAKTEALEIHIWSDTARRLMKLAVPAAKVEVVREVAKKP